MPPSGTPIWLDLATSDVDAAVAFYRALFGWTCDEPAAQFGGYRTFRKDGAAVAGLMKVQDPAQPVAWSIWLATDDARATLAAALAAGATPVFGPDAVGDLGVMAMFVDPTGAATGLWQPGTHRGVEATGWGTPAWYELSTRDYAAAGAFYRDLFDLPVEVVEDAAPLRYSRLGRGDQARAGLMDAAAFLPDGVPSHWAVYFAVPDVDAACARVLALGGHVVVPAADTPWGPMATVMDPQGGHFKLMTPRPA
ncbi:VOC family protein [Myxococcota bacterium]|nr:VOC family protein [Myxococcota bacterium]